MLMGSAGELPASITSKPTVETSITPLMPPKEDQSDAPRLPVGMANLGNTCYMNSALQLLFTIPEIRLFIQRYFSFVLCPLFCLSELQYNQLTQCHKS